MRIASYLLAVLVWVLSMVPCTDLGQHQEAATVVMNHSDENLPSSHENGNEMCSPFCQCDCCKTNVTIHFPSLLPSFVHPEAKPVADFKDPMDLADLMPLWQPPRA
jgi:hypothetical protein